MSSTKLAAGTDFHDHSGSVPARTRAAEYVKGVVMSLLCAGIWVGGLATPAVILACLAVGGMVANSILATVIFIVIYPHVAKPKEWIAWRQAIPEWGQLYHKECNLHFEEAIEDLAKAPPMIVCYHPHGIFAWGFILNGGCRKENHVGGQARPGLISDFLYYAPLFHWFMSRWTGAVLPASKKSFCQLMEDRRIFGLIPGGFEEATISKKGVDRVFIKSRKGFVKYALKYGYKLAPTYTFGEVDTYSNFQPFMKLRLWLNQYGIPGAIPFGVWWCPLLPQRVKINTVIGKPLSLPKIDNPTKEDVDKWHQEYIKQLQEMFERNKARFCSNPESQLEIW